MDLCCTQRELGLDPMSKAEDYINLLYCPPSFPNGAPCSRWWAHHRILVGGSIVSKEDGVHLARDFGIDVVISVESERDDGNRWRMGSAIWMPFPDIGAAPRPEVFRAILSFSWTCLRDMPLAKFYVHCQQGGSRSPAVAILLMRGLFGLDAVAALGAVRAHKLGYGDHPFHQAYLAAVEETLRGGS